MSTMTQSSNLIYQLPMDTSINENGKFTNYQYFEILNADSNSYNNIINYSPFEGFSSNELEIDFDYHRWAHEANNFSGLHINSTDEQIIFDDMLIYPNSIKMPNNKIIDLEYIENIRDGAGFEIDSTTKNDYIDLSGYELNDFISDIRPYNFDISLSPGNDVYINPTFRIDDKPSGQIDAGRYSKDFSFTNLQVPEQLRFEFLNENDLLIYDDTNGTITEAYNVSSISTSRTSQNIITAGEGKQSFSSYGLSDIITGGEDKDWFQLLFNEDNYENQQLIIVDYQNGETIRINENGFQMAIFLKMQETI